MAQKPQKEPSTRTSVTIPAEVYSSLEIIAKQKKVSMAWVIHDDAEKYVSEYGPLFAGARDRSHQELSLDLLFGLGVWAAQQLHHPLLVEQLPASGAFDLVVIEHLGVEFGAPHEVAASVNSGNLETCPCVELPDDRAFASATRAGYFACHKAPFRSAALPLAAKSRDQPWGDAAPISTR